MGILVLKNDFRLEWVSDTWPIAKTMSDFISEKLLWWHSKHFIVILSGHNHQLLFCNLEVEIQTRMPV